VRLIETGLGGAQRRLRRLQRQLDVLVDEVGVLEAPVLLGRNLLRFRFVELRKRRLPDALRRLGRRTIAIGARHRPHNSRSRFAWSFLVSHLFLFFSQLHKLNSNSV
jgi:hypothetical protein